MTDLVRGQSHHLIGRQHRHLGSGQSGDLGRGDCRQVDCFNGFDLCCRERCQLSRGQVAELIGS